MEELKKLYLAPRAQILCFKPVERLASWDEDGDGVIGEGGAGITAGPSGGDENGEGNGE